MEPKEASNLFAEVCICNPFTASLQTRTWNNSLIKMGVLVQGMRQVVSVKEMEQMLEKVEADELSKNNETSPAIGVPCQCACSPTNFEYSPDQAGLRAPLSAPF